jgi:hypothetical protein
MQKFPFTPEAVRSRGAWLGFAYVKAARGDLETMLNLLNLSTPPRSVFNENRLETAIYHLSKCFKKVGPILEEQFSDLRAEEVLKIRCHLHDGAWTALAFLFAPGEEDDFTLTYQQYLSAENPSALFWQRLFEHGVPIVIESCRRDLEGFDRTVLDGTVLCTMLDSVTIPQEEIEEAHRSMAEGLDPDHTGTVTKIFEELGFLPKR